ncbi:MAG TPA: hypothetical protein VFH95_03590 [Candidatus Kapabacteria bacterium]|nr:hypothetical protein [Candidatus Kapabacteria bacterium]
MNDIPKNAPEPEIPDFPPDPHIMDYLLLVSKYKWVVVSLIILCGVLALGLTYIVPYSFQSDAMLLPPDRISSSGLLSSLNAGGALKILKEVENPSVDLIQNLLESYALSDRLTRDSAVYHFFAHNSETRQEMVAQVQASLLTLPGFSNVNVRGRITTGWFSSAREKEEARRLAPYLANLACRTMDTMIGEVLRSDARQARIYADSDYVRRNGELDSLDGVKEQFEEQNGIPSLRQQTLATIGQVSQLEAEEDKAQIRLDVLERDFSSDNTGVEAARAELEEARAARSRYEYSSPIGPGLDTLPMVSRQYAELLRKLEVLEPIVTFLREERDQQDIFAERVRSVITIVDTAKTPDARFSPKRAPMLALGLSGGGFLSILYIALVTFLSSIPIRKHGAILPPEGYSRTP